MLAGHATSRAQLMHNAQNFIHAVTMVTAAVIDANAISRNLLSTVLQNGGLEVVAEANTSSAALAGVVKLAPQIICMDLGAPEDGGLEKLDSLRAAVPKALVFLVSAQFDAALVQAAAQRGVHGFIVKPFNATTVLTTIRRAIIKLARKHARQNGQNGQSGNDA